MDLSLTSPLLVQQNISHALCGGHTLPINEDNGVLKFNNKKPSNDAKINLRTMDLVTLELIESCAQSTSNGLEHFILQNNTF